MIQALRNAFTDNEASDCFIEIRNTLIEVFDCYECEPPLQRSYVRTKEEEPIHFTLVNDSNETVVFTALDNCLLKSADASRCDFVIGNFRELLFVEIKHVSTGQRRHARINAIEQLRSSITFLKNRINLEDTILVAVICLKAKKTYPVQSARSIAERVAFREQINTELMEGSSFHYNSNFS